MAIDFIAERGMFHLQSEHMSWVMQVGADGLLHHVYWGARLSEIPAFLYDRAPYRRAHIVENQPADSPRCTREFFHYECPTYGTSDFRIPALSAVECDSGSALLDLRYAGHEIVPGDVPPRGLPYADGCGTAQTLTVTLKDPLNGMTVLLRYRLFEELDIISRYMTLYNAGESAFTIDTAMSATVDFEDGSFDWMTFSGTTLREFTPDVRPLRPGIAEITSTRGSSSHQHSPNAVLLRPGTDALQGEAYGVSLLYGGSFTLRAELDPYGSCRLQGGINPLGFSWRLEKGESFDTPEMLLAWSGEGLNGLSERLHPFVRRHILRGEWTRRPRPLLLNTWEACYFDVNEERLLTLADESVKRGVELLVLDDGWFGRRNAANCSLGDWTCNPEKFPSGLDALADRLAEKGMKLGIWVEPEMVSPDSDLYRAHPDWCLHVDGRVRTEWRNQLVLDLSRDEVVDYVTAALDRIFESGKIAYVKWDMNRRLTEVGSATLPRERQGEVRHRYMLGLYRVLEHMAATYPGLLMENCASGGGRYDYGMYRYFHQGWLSDNTDAVCRLSMQTAASVFYPPEVITSHVATSPNHQIGRCTPIDFRTNVCALFNAGYELDPMSMTDAERESMGDISLKFKALRDTVRTGRFIRLNRELCPENTFGWMIVAPDKAVAGYYRAFCTPEAAYWTVPLRGLVPDARYIDAETGVTLSGADWERIGWRPHWREGDFFSELLVLTRV